MLRPDSGVVWLEETGHAFFDGQGRILRIIGMVGDVTERKRAEEALAGVSGRLIEAQDQERTRIARELHDDFSQRLAILGISAGHIWKSLPTSNVEVRDRVQEMLVYCPINKWQ